MDSVSVLKEFQTTGCTALIPNGLGPNNIHLWARVWNSFFPSFSLLLFRINPPKFVSFVRSEMWLLTCTWYEDVCLVYKYQTSPFFVLVFQLFSQCRCTWRQCSVVHFKSAFLVVVLELIHVALRASGTKALYIPPISSMRPANSQIKRAHVHDQGLVNPCMTVINSH